MTEDVNAAGTGAAPDELNEGDLDSISGGLSRDTLKQAQIYAKQHGVPINQALAAILGIPTHTPGKPKQDVPNPQPWMPHKPMPPRP